MFPNDADAWTILNSEVDSLFLLTRETGESFDLQPEQVQRAITSNLCKQTRDLIDILFSTKCRQDGVIPDRLLPRFRCEALDRLRVEYGDDRQIGSPCWLVGTLMNDAQLQGSVRHRSAQTLAQLIVTVDKIWQETQRHRPKGTRGKRGH